MRSNVARKQQETKSAASPTARAYRIEEQIGYLLRRAHQRASAIFQVTVGDPNITPTQYSSMVKLNEYTELSQNLLGRLVETEAERFKSDPKRAEALLKIGESPRDASISVVEHAAWTMLANTVMNMDEFLVK